MSIYTKILKKKKLVIFDLDGVLLNSRANMKAAWDYTSKCNNLTSNFNEYLQYVGLPFFKILEKMRIQGNYLDIKKNYSKGSKLNIHRNKLYPNVHKTLNKLKKLGKIVALYTSKDPVRTKLFLKKFDLNFDSVQCDNKNLKGKPHPDQLLIIMRELKIKKKDAILIGDTSHDYLASKNSKIDFIYAGYGFGKKIKHKFTIKKINQLIDG